MQTKVQETLNSLLEKFKTADIPQAIAIVKFPIPDIPMSKWSFFNQLLCVLSDSNDVRGFRQWHEVNRFVKKGSKAIYILVPMMYKKDDKANGEETQNVNQEGNVEIKNEKTESPESDRFLTGFKASPVFRVEDTEGEELSYNQIKLPEFPFLDKAIKWGLDVKINAFQEYSFARFKQDSKEIELATDDELTFFHELSHYSHSQVSGKLKSGQDADQEIVAQFCSEVLCHLVGKKTNVGFTYDYVESYAKNLGLTPYSAVFKLLNEINKVLDFILQEDE